MKLVLLYGPPAVGKLTIAQALQELTSFKLIHNHLISDMALSVLDRGTPEAADLNHRIRCLIYESTAKSGSPGIISTVLYRYDIKEQAHQAIQDYTEIVQKNGGQICVVRLSASVETLCQRVTGHSRIGTKKISSPEKLREVLEREDLVRELPETVAKSFHIDNTNMEPEEVALQIQAHFGL